MIGLQGQIFVPAGLELPARGQKQEKSYCDYLKNPMMSPNRRGPILVMLSHGVSPNFFTNYSLKIEDFFLNLSYEIITSCQAFFSFFLMLKFPHSILCNEKYLPEYLHLSIVENHLCLYIHHTKNKDDNVHKQRRNMQELQKIEMGVDKLHFHVFTLLSFLA